MLSRAETYTPVNQWYTMPLYELAAWSNSISEVIKEEEKRRKRANG